MTNQLQTIISKLDSKTISKNRKNELQVLIDYINNKVAKNKEVNFDNFIKKENNEDELKLYKEKLNLNILKSVF